MWIFLIILSCLCWAGSLLMLWKRQLLAPALSYIALVIISLATVNGGLPMLPVNNTILFSWLAMVLVVMTATMLQAPALRAQTRGMGYMTGGAFTGMVVGLLGYTFAPDSPSLLYSIMIVFTAIGLFLGFLMFTRTPAGKDVSISSGRFFKYLLAKGFPVAITVMIIGIAGVLTVLQLNN